MDVAWTALVISIKVAGCATIINILLGISAGYFFARRSFPGRHLLESLLALPLVMPPTVIGYYLLVLLGRNGWIGHALEKYFNVTLIFTWQGATIAAAIVSFPLIFKPACAAFQTVDRHLEDAARVLGISEISLFFRITLPLASRGILAGVLLAFARCLGEFGATLMIAGNIPGKTQTLSTAVYEAVQTGQDQVANTLVIITSLVCVTVLLAVKRLTPDPVKTSHK